MDDHVFICERCEEEYTRTSHWDDQCYCEPCAKETYPEYWKLETGGESCGS